MQVSHSSSSDAITPLRSETAGYCTTEPATKAFAMTPKNFPLNKTTSIAFHDNVISEQIDLAMKKSSQPRKLSLPKTSVENSKQPSPAKLNYNHINQKLDEY